MARVAATPCDPRSHPTAANAARVRPEGQSRPVQSTPDRSFFRAASGNGCGARFGSHRVPSVGLNLVRVRVRVRVRAITLSPTVKYGSTELVPPNHFKHRSIGPTSPVRAAASCLPMLVCEIVRYANWEPRGWLCPAGVGGDPPFPSNLNVYLPRRGGRCEPLVRLGFNLGWCECGAQGARARGFGGSGS
jgi:hypothetical protein